jgi:hypothetical protein
MRHKESLERVGEREEAVPQKEAHDRAVLAAFDCSGSGTRRATSGASSRASSTTCSGSLSGGL